MAGLRTSGRILIHHKGVGVTFQNTLPVTAQELAVQGGFFDWNVAMPSLTVVPQKTFPGVQNLPLVDVSRSQDVWTPSPSTPVSLQKPHLRSSGDESYLSTIYNYFDLAEKKIQNGPPEVRGFLESAGYWMVAGGSLLGTLAGVHWGVPEPLLVGSVSFASFTGAWILENIIPYRPDWRPDKDEVTIATMHNLVSTAVIPEMCKQALGVGLGFFLGTSLADGFPGLNLFETWGLGAQVLTGLLAVDFIHYWIHRSLHLTETFWPIHEVHHLTEKMSSMAAGVNHPLNVILTYGAISGVLSLLGMDPVASAILTGGFIVPNGYLQHSNANLKLGPLGQIISGPSAHRLHHSTDMTEGNSNFGNTLLLWDHVFGTYTDTSLEPDEVGVTQRGYLEKDKTWFQNYKDQLIYPLKQVAAGIKKGLSRFFSGWFK